MCPRCHILCRAACASKRYAGVVLSPLLTRQYGWLPNGVLFFTDELPTLDPSVCAPKLYRECPVGRFRVNHSRAVILCFDGLKSPETSNRISHVIETILRHGAAPHLRFAPLVG